MMWRLSDSSIRRWSSRVEVAGASIMAEMGISVPKSKSPGFLVPGFEVLSAFRLSADIHLWSSKTGSAGTRRSLQQQHAQQQPAINIRHNMLLPVRKNGQAPVKRR